jgi:hypothetical protein
MACESTGGNVRPTIGKGLFLVLIAAVAAGGLTGQEPAKDPTPLAYFGMIMDGQCGKTGSHAAMMKKEGTKGPRSCTNYCVKMGAQYVLFDPQANTMFQLDDQEKASAFAGRKVKVVGSFDPDTKTIHIQEIQSPSVNGAP